MHNEIEIIHKRALRTFLPSSYREALGITDITTLKDRRERLCNDFFQQNKQNEKLTYLFPELTSVHYDLRIILKFNQYLCKTDLFKNSFLPQVISK